MTITGHGENACRNQNSRASEEERRKAGKERTFSRRLFARRRKRNVVVVVCRFLSLSLSSITIDKVSQYYRWLVTLDSDVIRLNHGVVFLRERETTTTTTERVDDDINANK